MKKVKIIVPIYNTEKFLERCLESILCQTKKNFELILVDDGSFDACPQICDRYASQDSRIHVIHQKNAGLSAARNTGLAYPIECNYITFVDSDDWIHPRYLEVLLCALEKTGCSVAASAHIKTPCEIEMQTEFSIEPKRFCAEDCYCLKTISTTPVWAKLYKTELLQDFQFPVNVIHEDYYTTWKLLFRAETIAVVEQPIYYYYLNPHGLMRAEWTPRHMDFFPAIKEKIDFFHNNHFECAEQRAIFKLIKTTEKFIDRAKNTHYADEYVPRLKEILAEAYVLHSDRADKK